MNTRNEELDAIRNVANLYIDGVREGNVDVLRKAFHPRAMMYGTSAGSEVIVEIEGLFSYVTANEAPAKRGEPHQCFITGISYAGNAAMVEMVEESSYGNDYTNYFQLLKINGNWIIMSKSYNGVAREQ